MKQLNLKPLSLNNYSIVITCQLNNSIEFYYHKEDKVYSIKYFNEFNKNLYFETSNSIEAFIHKKDIRSDWLEFQRLVRKQIVKSI